MRLFLIVCLMFTFSLEAQISLKLMQKEKRVALVIVNDKYQGLKKIRLFMEKIVLISF